MAQKKVIFTFVNIVSLFSSVQYKSDKNLFSQWKCVNFSMPGLTFLSSFYYVKENKDSC
jgi:hypothetical protein